MKSQGKNKSALKEFNKAKRESAYADDCLRYMLEIFVNPQNDLYFSFSEEVNSIKQVDGDNVRGAENVLLDCKSRITDQNKFMSQYAFLLAYGRNDCTIIAGQGNRRKKGNSNEIIEQAN